MLNRCEFIGRLGADPEARNTQSGASVVNFRLAASERYKDKSGEKQERTEWVSCVAWNKLADICAQYLHKGSLVYVAGRMQTRKWQDQSGQDRYSTEIVLSEMTMLGSKQDGQQSAPRPQQQAVEQAGGGDPFNDDVPFNAYMKRWGC